MLSLIFEVVIVKSNLYILFYKLEMLESGNPGELATKSKQ